MQLLNPQQEHALPRAMTRLSAYLWGGLTQRLRWTGTVAEFLTTGDETHGCREGVYTCDGQLSGQQGRNYGVSPEDRGGKKMRVEQNSVNRNII